MTGFGGRQIYCRSPLAVNGFVGLLRCCPTLFTASPLIITSPRTTSSLTTMSHQATSRQMALTPLHKVPTTPCNSSSNTYALTIPTLPKEALNRSIDNIHMQARDEVAQPVRLGEESAGHATSAISCGRSVTAKILAPTALVSIKGSRLKDIRLLTGRAELGLGYLEFAERRKSEARRPEKISLSRRRPKRPLMLQPRTEPDHRF